MKKTHSLLTLFLLIAVMLISRSSGQPVRRSQQQATSPAQRAVDAARNAIEKDPKQYSSYNQLALALARRARETSDTSFYAQAEAALRKSFALAPANFEGRKIEAWLLLGRHEFARALEIARDVNKKVPDDVMVYGLLADAHAELGNYQEAEKAVNWMLDLRPATVPGLTRAAYLRELFGDQEGALELLQMSLESISLSEREDRAWILTQIGHLHILTGQRQQAEAALTQALRLFPDYHYALGNMGKLRMLEKKYSNAVELFRKRYEQAPHAENLYPLGEALEQVGERSESRKVFAEFERKARAESARADNANRELILYYIDHAKERTEALRLARTEVERRQDVLTLDAYAWALCANGEYKQARKHIERALAVGVRDAEIFYHAGVIALKLKDKTGAKRYLRESAALNSLSSREARVMLAQLRNAR